MDPEGIHLEAPRPWRAILVQEVKTLQQSFYLLFNQSSRLSTIGSLLHHIKIRVHFKNSIYLFVLATLYQFRILLRVFTRPYIANRIFSDSPSLYILDIFASDQGFTPSVFNAYQSFTYIGIEGSFTFLSRLAYSLLIIVSSFLIVIPESSLRAYASITLLSSYN